MAFASADADKPVLPAVYCPGLHPSRMEESAEWEKAQQASLGGFDGASAQEARVSALWNEEWLFFRFDCSDGVIVSPGSEDGLDHFRSGDTAEIFITRRGDKSYAEIHATPAGRKTIYYCSDYRQTAEPPETAGAIRVEASQSPRGWRVFFAVPRKLFGPVRQGDGYDIFFGRYDYAAEGGKPELSSYPGLHGIKPDFHRRENYAILLLTP